MATQTVKFTGPAGNLEGVLHLPDVRALSPTLSRFAGEGANERLREPDTIEPRAIVVVAHPLPTMGGTMDNKIVTTLAKTFAELGFVALRFNFRGVGDSCGEFDSGNGEVEDMLAVIEHAKDAFGHLPLILAGFSFGGYVAARAAQHIHPQPHKLVLVAPAVGRFAMPHVAHNTLLIHGELDEVIPLSDAFDWARPQHLPVVVLPEAGHFFHGRLNQLKQIVLREFNGCSL
ncbi:MAG: alpha/beta fold hydrolase [Gallionella sp.]|jgi:hypothetical protein